ncbi:glucuronate isomerase [Alkalihalobacillus oceani]|uniref:Uronate isomerase n=1 Tax=Halalkalibacter oceani TaxID=1653776 RepID=A0A9X2DNZ5_9BACI|nr:glucuronate isomerase [Halalkalibacter oceani]MCM3714446.1 glucuronate isomerase [Halalkalibacter oceani]
MKAFMDDDFLLETATAKALYHTYAKKMPIIDYHCHLSAKEIAENKQFSTLTEVWLGDDHYKWRALRANGIPEHYITGQSSEKEKFMKWADTIPALIGNPLYHWTHLELQRCFGIEEILTPETAEAIWNEGNQQLQTERFKAKEVIKRFRVKALCTTDDPVDSLQYHKQLKEDQSFDVKVLPTFRPDGALAIEKPAFSSWVHELEQAAAMPIRSLADFKAALAKRIDYFDEAGCRLSDHSLESAFFKRFTEEEVEAVFQRALRKEVITEAEAVPYKTALMIYLGELYAEKGWAMQFHIGGLRNANTRMVAQVGPNTGFDSIADFTYAGELAHLLDELEKKNRLPKTILYCLNPRDNYMVAALAGNFQSEIPGKIQFGTAWWFNDQRDGMEEQIKTLANVGILANFIGMLTDSRSLLSYTRHEYFRRILCNMVGRWVENGEYPAQLDYIGKIIENISYRNIESYLGLEIEEETELL